LLNIACTLVIAGLKKADVAEEVMKNGQVNREGLLFNLRTASRTASHKESRIAKFQGREMSMFCRLAVRRKSPCRRN
jgi:hypothetical protein